MMCKTAGMRWMRILAVAVASCAHAPAAAPPPPEAPKLPAWIDGCADRLRTAQQELSRDDPAWAAAQVVIERDPPGVKLDMLVPDAEHGRFYDGAPARFSVSVSEKASAQAGALGGTSGSADDDRASISMSTWSTERVGTLDAQIAGGKKVFAFDGAFSPAIDDCLR